ncbi:MAG: hypothetical protein ABWZ30_02680 [Jiangellaceae bacterium]
MTDAALPDLALGLIRIRDARDRLAEEGAGILAHYGSRQPRRAHLSGGAKNSA